VGDLSGNRDTHDWLRGYRGLRCGIGSLAGVNSIEIGAYNFINHNVTTETIWNNEKYWINEEIQRGGNGGWILKVFLRLT
jgi:hypothetical protein